MSSSSRWSSNQATLSSVNYYSRRIASFENATERPVKRESVSRRDR